MVEVYNYLEVKKSYNLWIFVFYVINEFHKNTSCCFEINLEAAPHKSNGCTSTCFRSHKPS